MSVTHNMNYVLKMNALIFLGQHNMNYVGTFSFALNHQPKPLDFSAVFGAGGHYIYACGVDAAVT